jgi:hypothetical protein
MPSRILILLLLFISLDVIAASMEDTQAPASTPAPVPVNSAPIDEKANDKATCAAKWDRYHKSQDCFAPYHNVDGSMKPGAFEHCTEVKEPSECPL